MAPQAQGTSQGSIAGKAAARYWNPETEEMAPVRK